MMRMIDIDSICRISLLGKANRLIHLDILCDDTAMYGLWHMFKDSNKIKEYIKLHTDEAYKNAVHKMEEDHYVLNCQTHCHIFTSEESWMKDQKNMILVFMPIIQKFMIDVLNGTLQGMPQGQVSDIRCMMSDG